MPIAEVVLQLDLQKFCYKQPVCVLSFLPPLRQERSGAASRTRRIKILGKVSTQFPRSSFSFLWVDGGVHKQLESSFGIGDESGAKYPAVVRLTASKRTFSVFNHTFDFASLEDFVQGADCEGFLAKMMGGGAAASNTLTLASPLARLAKSTKPWRGFCKLDSSGKCARK